MSRHIVLAGALLLATPLSVQANPGQEQVCAGEVSQMQGIPMSEVRVVHTNGSRAGISEVILNYPGGKASCMVDANNNILDIRWNHKQGVSHPGGGKHADKNGQEQACAGYFSQKMNTAMSEVRVRNSKPTKHGHLLVTVSVPGMTGRCNVDAHYNVVGFSFLGDQ